MTPETRVYTATSDGEEYRFLFNHRGLIAAERAADGTGLAKLLTGFAQGNIGYIAALIQGGLSAHHPELTLDACLDLWEAENEPLLVAMGEALEAAMPVVTRMLGIVARPRQPRGTGTRSSRSGSKRGSTKAASSTRARAASPSS